MDAPLSLFLLMFVPPAALAFIGQLACTMEARHRLRRWTAGLWVALIAGLSSWSNDESGHWLGIALFMLTVLGLSFLIAYAGSLAGSLAALRLKSLRRA
ncbi:MAG TPA: hypothetical protein VF702_06965 [Allosphingosinicella sp.]|jgi:hypothetical protein